MPLYNFEGHEPKIGKDCFIAPNATLIGDIEIGDKCNILFGVVIRADVNKIIIGSGTNIQDNSVVHCNTTTQTIIGNDVTIGHGCLVHACTIQDRALVGNQSVIHDNAFVGEEALISPGCVITDRTEVKPRTLMVGIPGVYKRDLQEKDYEKMKGVNLRYKGLIRHYSTNFYEIKD